MQILKSLLIFFIIALSQKWFNQNQQSNQHNNISISNYLCFEIILQKEFLVLFE
jgi:hypothetical protein